MSHKGDFECLCVFNYLHIFFIFNYLYIVIFCNVYMYHQVMISH